MSPPADALEAALRVARALDLHRVPYAIGGALAYGQCGIPRATNGVDVNVFVPTGELAPVFAALRSLGVAVDEPRGARASRCERSPSGRARVQLNAGR